MKNWPATALNCLATEPTAMITLAAIAGSTPREAGARMIVTPTQAHGTVGGGNLEFLLIDQARRLLASDLHILQQDYPLGPLLAQCCGGHVRVLVERLAPATWLRQAAEAETSGQPYTLMGVLRDGRITRSVAAAWPANATEGAWLEDATGPVSRRASWTRITEHIRPAATHLYIYGAGHVGRALVHIAETLPVRLHWYDTRADLLGTDPRLTILEDLSAPLLTAPAGSFHVVLTHAHELDYQIVRAILQRGDAAYCGLIGSATKRARFLSRLAKDGVDPTGLTCPIGEGLIRSKLPAAIAVAVSLELLTRLESAAAAQSPSVPEPKRMRNP